MGAKSNLESSELQGADKQEGQAESHEEYLIRSTVERQNQAGADALEKHPPIADLPANQAFTAMQQRLSALENKMGIQPEITPKVIAPDTPEIQKMIDDKSEAYKQELIRIVLMNE